MGGVCAQLLTDIDPKIASQMGPHRRKNAEAKHVEIWHEVPAMADSHFFFFLRNSDITKKKKRQNKTVKTNKNNDLRLLIIWFRSRLKKCNGVLTLLLLNQKRTEGI